MVKMVLKTVRSKMSKMLLMRNTSSTNKVKWWITTDSKMNENRSGVKTSLMRIVWYS